MWYYSYKIKKNMDKSISTFLIILYSIFGYSQSKIVGKIIAQNKNAYKYLSDSAQHFPHGKEFKLILERIGFENIKIKYLSLGIVNIYYAEKPK